VDLESSAPEVNAGELCNGFGAKSAAAMTSGAADTIIDMRENALRQIPPSWADWRTT
jgi:hypothetical protein